MCQYKYIEDGVKSKKDTYCNLYTVKDKYNPTLPLDSNGHCLFHSKDSDFRKKHDLNLVFKETINWLNCTESEIYSFNETVFGGFEFSEIVIKDCYIDKKIDFAKSNFLSSVTFDNITFNKNLYFNAFKTFERIEFKNCTFDELDFSSAKQGVFLIFDECKFNGDSVIFYDSNFRIDTHLIITNCYFTSIVNFDDSKLPSFRIENTVFRNTVSFETTKFQQQLIFDNVTFCSNVDFINSTFKILENTTDYRFQPVSMTNLILQESAVLNFKGKKPQSLFVEEVDIDFLPENLKGKIHFKNVNLNFLTSKSKSLIFGLLHTNRINIGSGCLKYRHETPKKRININAESQNLVTELSNTFVQYFKNKNGVNLGVEVRDRDENFIEIVYFTDDDISFYEFEEMLKNSDESMWKLIKFSNQKLVAEQSYFSFPDKVIAGSDTVINLIGTILKILTRIPLGKISKNELASLISSTSINSNNQISTEQFNTLNINQFILLGIGNDQSIKF